MTDLLFEACLLLLLLLLIPLYELMPEAAAEIITNVVAVKTAGVVI